MRPAAVCARAPSHRRSLSQAGATLAGATTVAARALCARAAQEPGRERSVWAACKPGPPRQWAASPMGADGAWTGPSRPRQGIGPVAWFHFVSFSEYIQNLANFQKIVQVWFQLLILLRLFFDCHCRFVPLFQLVPFTHSLISCSFLPEPRSDFPDFPF
jgi:hypothetical protein